MQRATNIDEEAHIAIRISDIRLDDYGSFQYFVSVATRDDHPVSSDTAGKPNQSAQRINVTKAEWLPRETLYVMCPKNLAAFEYASVQRLIELQRGRVTG